MDGFEEANLKSCIHLLRNFPPICATGVFSRSEPALSGACFTGLGRATTRATIGKSLANGTTQSQH